VTCDVVVLVPVVTTLGGFVDMMVLVVVSSIVDVSAVVDVAVVEGTVVVVVTVVGLGILTVLAPDVVVEGFNDEVMVPIVISGVVFIVVDDQVDVGSVFEKYIYFVN
jgi:hypothetical protein